MLFSSSSGLLPQTFVLKLFCNHSDLREVLVQLLKNVQYVLFSCSCFVVDQKMFNSAGKVRKAHPNWKLYVKIYVYYRLC